MTERVVALLTEAGLTVNASVIATLVERHSDRDVIAAAETAATWAADGQVKTRNGTSLFRSALERAPRRKLAPGETRVLVCFACGSEYDPAKARIKSRRVCPAAYCNDCLAAQYAAGRWQEVLLYEAAA